MRSLAISFAIAFVVIGFKSTNFIMLPLVAVFVFVGAMTEERMVRIKFGLGDKCARDFVRASRADNEPVAVVGLAAFPYSRYYAPDWRVLEGIEDLQRLRNSEPAVWVVFSFSTHLRSKYPEIANVLETDFRLERRFLGTLGDGTIYVYRERDGSP